jgi:hypothetical protein
VRRQSVATTALWIAGQVMESAGSPLSLAIGQEPMIQFRRAAWAHDRIVTECGKVQA